MHQTKFDCKYRDTDKCSENNLLTIHRIFHPNLDTLNVKDTAQDKRR